MVESGTQSANSSDALAGQASLYISDADVCLMCKVQEGDANAYALLWERHHRPLEAFIRRIVRIDCVAEELAQEVFLRVFRARESYQPSAKFSTWLFRIGSHVALNWIRDQKHEHYANSTERSLQNIELFEPADDRPSVEQALVNGSKAWEIRQAIHRLPINQRQAVILHKYRDFDYPAISRSLHCSESAVKSLLFRAYEHLRRSLAYTQVSDC